MTVNNVYLGIMLTALLVFTSLQMSYWVAAAGILLVVKQLGRIATALEGEQK